MVNTNAANIKPPRAAFETMNNPGSGGGREGVILGLAFAFVGVCLILMEQYVMKGQGILYGTGFAFTGFGLFMTAAFTDH